ncbi:MAG: triose-phosphate isomerase [Pseudomonadales bacterium]
MTGPVNPNGPLGGRRAIVAGNWKMNGDLAFVERYVELLRNATRPSAVDVVLCPPACYLPALLTAVAGLGIGLGGQDVHWLDAGPCTGSIAAAMIRDCGAEWTIVGHSERRIGLGERDDIVADKVEAALRAGLRPIVCVGETLAERESGSADAVVLRQLDAVLARVSPGDMATLTFAYEPVWAIGTGRTATPEMAQAVHALIRSRLVDRNPDAAKSVSILYGGSVTPDNARRLAQELDIDGALVGGAALDPTRLLQIATAFGERVMTVPVHGP